MLQSTNKALYSVRMRRHVSAQSVKQNQAQTQENKTGGKLDNCCSVVKRVTPSEFLMMVNSFLVETCSLIITEYRAVLTDCNIHHFQVCCITGSPA